MESTQSTFVSSFTTKDVIIVALLICLVGVIIYLALQSVQQNKKIESVRALYYTQQLNVNEYLREFMSSPNNVPLVQSWIDPAVRPMVRYYVQQQQQPQAQPSHSSQSSPLRDQGPPPLESEMKTPSFVPIPPQSQQPARANPLEQIMGMFGGLLNGGGVGAEITLNLGGDNGNGGGLGALGGLLTNLLGNLNNRNNGDDGDNTNHEHDEDDNEQGGDVQPIQ